EGVRLRPLFGPAPALVADRAERAAHPRPAVPRPPLRASGKVTRRNLCRSVSPLHPAGGRRPRPPPAGSRGRRTPAPPRGPFGRAAGTTDRNRSDPTCFCEGCVHLDRGPRDEGQEAAPAGADRGDPRHDAGGAPGEAPALVVDEGGGLTPTPSGHRDRPHP